MIEKLKIEELEAYYLERIKTSLGDIDRVKLPRFGH